jgi:hypothetical protein
VALIIFVRLAAKAEEETGASLKKPRGRKEDRR